MLPIYALTPFTLLDFPGVPAAVVWCAGCNMRCAYCHNPEIVRGKAGHKSVTEVLTFLEARRGLLEGVVLSGGEATLWDGLLAFVEAVRDMGYKVKLDTNGTRPQVLSMLLPHLDYVALDYKAPPYKYHAITRHKDFAAFHRALSLLCRQSATPFEVRTTVHGDLLDAGDIAYMARDLEALHYRGTYYLQPFRGDVTLRPLAPCPPLDTIALPTPRGFAVEWRV